MLDFSSVSPHLQARITEKIDYFDQRAFELSSKLGKHAVTCTKQKAVIELELFSSSVEFVHLNENVTKQCSDLCRFSHLPRFKVKKIWIKSGQSIDSLIELCSKHEFVENGVFLIWRWEGSGEADFSTLTVLLELFRVTSLNLLGPGPIDQSILSLPKFHEISRLRLTSAEIPDEHLLLIQSSVIALENQNVNRISVTTNLFLKQWFAKERNMEYFEMESEALEKWQGSIDTDTTFSDIPFEAIRTYNLDANHHKLIFFKYLGFFHSEKRETVDVFNIHKEHLPSIHYIDRGDKKMVVFVMMDQGDKGVFELVRAQECTNVGEVFRTMIRNEDRCCNLF